MKNRLLFLTLIIISGVSFTSAQWIQQNSGTLVFLQGVSFTDNNYGTVVGDGGMILRTIDGGQNWFSQNSGTINSLTGVSFADINNGTAVGNYGTIICTTNGGDTWTIQLSGVTNDLLGVSFSDAINGTAVGEEGVILRTTNGGQNWFSQVSGTANMLTGVSFTDADNGTAVGTFGTILRTTNAGQSWHSQTGGLNAPLTGVSFTDADNGTAVGRGLILRTTNAGQNWTHKLFGTDYYLSGVSFTDANNGTVVGYDLDNSLGIILRTTDGGENWLNQTSGTDSWLWAVFFTDANNGTAVGDGGTILRTTNGGGTPTIEIMTPNGGDFLAIGDEVQIQWSAQGYFESFDLDLSTNGGATWINIESDINGSQNSHNWVVWDILCGNCKIGITGNLAGGGTIEDESEGTFTIVYPYLFFDDFSYTIQNNNYYNEMDEFGWRIVDGVSNPPSGALYKKENVRIAVDPINNENKLLLLDTETTNEFNDMSLSRVETKAMEYLDGIYISRISFDNSCRVWNDANVETFFSLSELRFQNDPDYSECDFEYLSWDVWGATTSPKMYIFTYETYQDTPIWKAIRDSSSREGELVGWNIYVYEVRNSDQTVNYYIGNDINFLYEFIAEHDFAKDYNGNWVSVYPESEMNISFANWIYTDQFGSGLGSSQTQRTNTIEIDWVLHSKDQELKMYGNSIDTLENIVANLRANGITRANTIHGSMITNIEEDQSFNEYTIAKDFYLYHNYPNPFNPNTKIKYQIPELSFVTLKVYDVLGNEIAKIVSEEKPAGSYEIEFDASSLPSGVYFYRLQAVPTGRQAGSFAETKKMVLLR